MICLVKLLGLTLMALGLSEATYGHAMYNKGYYYNPYLAQMYQHYLMKGFIPRHQMMPNYVHANRFPHPGKTVHDHVQPSMKEAGHLPDPRESLKHPMKAPTQYDAPPINIINMKNHNYPPSQPASRGPIKIYNVNNHHEAPVIPAEPQNIQIMNIDQEIASKDVVHAHPQPNIHIANIDQTHEEGKVHSTIEQVPTEIVSEQQKVHTGEEMMIQRMPRNEPPHITANGNNGEGFVINRLPIASGQDSVTEVDQVNEPAPVQVESQIENQPAAIHEQAPYTMPGFNAPTNGNDQMSTDGSHIPEPAHEAGTPAEPTSEELTQPDMTGFSEELHRIARQSETAPTQ